LRACPNLPGRGQDQRGHSLISLTPSRKVVALKLKYTRSTFKIDTSMVQL
jgi:hypothetical protein